MSITLQEFARLVNHQLPPGLTFDRVYQAFEGDTRVIAKDSAGREYRFTIVTTPEGFLTLEPM
jgi:hypothetical protein